MNKMLILSKECPYGWLFTQWQILRMLSYVVVDGNSFPQWQVPVGLLFPIGNILYNRTRGKDIQTC